MQEGGSLDFKLVQGHPEQQPGTGWNSEGEVGAVTRPWGRPPRRSGAIRAWSIASSQQRVRWMLL